jgi:hypothetical protein
MQELLESMTTPSTHQTEPAHGTKRFEPKLQSGAGLGQRDRIIVRQYASTLQD